VVGDEVLRSAYPMAAVLELRPGMLREVRDYDLGQASAPLDSPEYYELLSYVENAPDEEFSPPERPVPEVLPVQLLKDPAEWRGKVVSITGVLLYLREMPLGPRGENPLGQPRIWRMWISDNRSGQAGTVLALSLRPPPVDEHDIVELTGLFFRRLAYESNQQEPRIASVVMAREVHAFVPPPDTVTPVIVRSIAGMVLLVLVLLVVGQLRERRAMKVARDKRIARKRKRLAGGHDASEPGTGMAPGGELAEGGAGASAGSTP
jgi:hypothetical protein